jgi:type I restriction enzyme M protein
VVLANPPYSIKQWNREAFSADPYGRNVYGVPPQGRADYAFFQHIIASLKPRTGRCAILFPHGVLFREEEHHMRARLVEDDVLEAVIGLGPNLFYNSPMEACVVVCRTQKAPERRGRVIFINAVGEVTRERAQSFLERDHIDKIVGAYRAFEDMEGFARVATLDEIRAERANLSIPLYVPLVGNGNGDGADGKSLADIIAEWEQSSRALRIAMEDLMVTLDGLADSKPG